MNRIHLIFTRHEERGECNAANLLAILERIKPEVIFEELDTTLFDKIYRQHIRKTLESNVIKLYRERFPVLQVPVDTLAWREARLEADMGYMLSRVEGQITREAFDYNQLLEDMSGLVDSHGFHYLNSDDNDKVCLELDRLRRLVLDQLGDENLLGIDREMEETFRKREATMIDNIMEYASKHPFETGVFYIGSGHRPAILKQIVTLREQGTTSIEWMNVAGSTI